MTERLRVGNSLARGCPGTAFGDSREAKRKLFEAFSVPVDKNLVPSPELHDMKVEPVAQCRALLISLPFDLFDPCSQLGFEGGFGGHQWGGYGVGGLAG